MTLRAKIRGEWRIVSKAMARRFRARGIEVTDDEASAPAQDAPNPVNDLYDLLAGKTAAPLPATVDVESFSQAAAELHAAESTDSAVDGHAAQGDPASGVDVGSPETPATADSIDIGPNVVAQREQAAIAVVEASSDPALCVLPGGEIISETALAERMLAEKSWGIEFTGSSNLRSARLSEVTGTVEVLFKNGKTYRYANFTRAMMIEWESADSPGGWFHKNVKTKPDRHPVVADKPANPAG